MTLMGRRPFNENEDVAELGRAIDRLSEGRGLAIKWANRDDAAATNHAIFGQVVDSQGTLQRKRFLVMVILGKEQYSLAQPTTSAGLYISSIGNDSSTFRNLQEPSGGNTMVLVVITDELGGFGVSWNSGPAASRTSGAWIHATVLGEHTSDKMYNDE